MNFAARALFCLCLIAGTRPYDAAYAQAPAPSSSPTTALGRIALWPAQAPLPGIGNVPVVTGGATQPNLFTGYLPTVMHTPNQPAVAVTGFRQAQQQPFTVAVALPRFALPALVPALQGTALADIFFDQAVMIFVPHGSGTRETTLPNEVARLLNRNSVTLAEGVNFFASASVYGQTSAFLAQSGARSTSLPVSGRFDPAVLAPPTAGNAPLTEAFLQMLDLSISLGNVSLPGVSFLAFNNARLNIRRAAQGVAPATIVADLAARMGPAQPLGFPGAQLSRDPATGTLTLSGGLIKPPAGAIRLPARMTSLDTMSIAGTVAGNTHAFTLSGNAIYAGKPDKYQATLTDAGNGIANYAFSGDASPVATAGGGAAGEPAPASRSLAQLLGAPIPGLNEITVSNITSGNGFTSAHVGVTGLKFMVVAFKGAGQAGTNAAFIPEAALYLPALMPALRGTPLGDLELSNSALVYAPAGNGEASVVNLPEPVARQLGMASLELKSGLNLITQVRPQGDLATLLGRAGFANAQLPLRGTLDPTVLAGIKDSVPQTFLNLLDLSIPLGTIPLPGAHQSVSLTNASLGLKGVDRGIEAAIRGHVAISTGGAPLNFDTQLSLMKTASGQTLSLTGSLPGAWNQPLGIPWLNLRNVGLKGSIGQTNEIAISGVTNIGRLRDLEIKLDLAATSRRSAELTLEIGGADIPLSDIPGLSAIPHAADVQLRDLFVSNRSIGGTVKTSLPLIADARAVAFTAGGHWNLAVLLEKLDLAKLVPLPAQAQQLLGAVHLDTLAVVLSAGGLNASLADLPAAAQDEMKTIFGATSGSITMDSGINLLLSFSPAQLGPGVANLLPAGGNVVIQGGVGGIFGGPPRLDLALDIPTIQLPQSAKFIALPVKFQPAFFISLTEASVAAGVRLDAQIGVNMAGQNVVFDGRLALQVDTSGGVSVDLQGKTLSDWANPLGVTGFTLNAGTRLELKASATSEVTATILGKTHIGSKEVDVIGSISALIAEETIDKGAFEGKVSEVGLQDIIAIANVFAAANGVPPIQSGNLPVAALRNVDFAFASPGVTIPEMNLDGGGIRIGGDLWVLLNDQPLGKVFAEVSLNGITLSGKLADITLGPIAFRNNFLDGKATISPPTLPYFKMHGGVDLFGKQQQASLTMNLTERDLTTDLDLGELLKFDFRVHAGTPNGGYTLNELAQIDWNLKSRLKSDLAGWLRDSGKKPIEAAMGTIKSGLDQFIRDVNTAQAVVDKLNGQIAQAKNEARGRALGAEAALAAARQKVDGLQAQINNLNAAINNEKSRLRPCNFTKTVAIGLVRITVLDIGRNAQCNINNIALGAAIASQGAQLVTLAASKAIADKVLSDLQSGIGKTDVADLDPKVIALEADLLVATGALQTAKHLAEGVEAGGQLFDAAMNNVAQSNFFVLNDSLIEGSLRKAIEGKPVVMGLHFTAAGQEHHMGFAMSFTDPLFTINQLDALALFVFSVALEVNAKARGPVPPGLQKLVQEAYLAKANTVAAELAKAMQESGLQ